MNQTHPIPIKSRVAVPVRFCATSRQVIDQRRQSGGILFAVFESSGQKGRGVHWAFSAVNCVGLVPLPWSSTGN